MSVTTSVYGIVPPDGTWTKMKAVWDACEAADVTPPAEVADFFGDELPDPGGQIVEIASSAWTDPAGDADGLEVVLALIPGHVKAIRFVNCW